MCFWWRSCLFIFYAVIIVYSSYLFEWWLLLESGYTSYQIIQPLQNLSIGQLQLLLENRGISHTAFVEKSEIVDILQYSGPVQYMELLLASDALISNTPLEISGRDEFYEKVSEDSESVWLIEVVPEESLYTGHRLLDDASWKKLNMKLMPIGIKTAVIKCPKEPKLCAKQGWIHPQIVLSVPRPGYGSHLIQFPSVAHLSVKVLLNWLHEELYDLVHKVKSVCELEAIWLNSTLVEQKKISKMVYVSELINPPLLLITLGLRFSSRFKFAVYTTGQNDRDQVAKVLQKHKINGPPALVITSGDSVSSYGYEKGEIFSLNALEIYTKLLRPKMNDVFMVTLFLANFFVLIDFLDIRGRVMNHFGRSFFSIPTYNAMVLFLWLLLTSAIKFPWMNLVLNGSSFITQLVDRVTLFSFISYHFIIMEYFIIGIVAMFLAMALLLFIFRNYLGGNRILPNEESANESSWYTIFPLDSYLVNALFRPMTSLSRPRPSHDLGLEEGMEMLIERLATPNLWLHPAISNEYIKDLSTWRYDGWGNEEDLKSESETDWDSLSETENERLLESHTCCEDEFCKMCTLWATVKETYVCHRCAILKRKFEKQYLRYRGQGDSASQNNTYQKLLKVCSNCTRTRKNNPPKETKYANVGQWLSRQRVTELRWTAPTYAIETRLCAICLDRYRWSAVLCGLPCGHTYHHSCVMEWLSKDNHHCPTCRWPSYKAKLNVANI